MVKLSFLTQTGSSHLDSDQKFPKAITNLWLRLQIPDPEQIWASKAVCPHLKHEDSQTAFTVWSAAGQFTGIFYCIPKEKDTHMKHFAWTFGLGYGFVP